MVGLSEAQLRAFSKRTVQIEHHLAAVGAAPGDGKARMQAYEAASVATRPAKDRSLTPERLQDRWDSEATEVGLATGGELIDVVRSSGTVPRSPTRVELVELFDRLIDPEFGLCAHDSRFGEAQVVAHIAAWGAGRLGVDDIEALTRGFLDSDLVVRLINRDRSGRAPGQWSTVAHRRLEDRLLADLEGLVRRASDGLRPAAVDAALAAAVSLGGDQEAAVRLLCRSGPVLRALISPAGYGKTTTVAAAADAARGAGRPVVALSTTNQAVDQLRRSGIEASTVARFALDGAVLPAGCVLIVDEFSQMPTREADIVARAATACPDGLVWLVGDPLQAQAVAAGGLATWVAEQARLERVPMAELTVNRRQADPFERQALTHLRAGQVDASQQLRDQRGWEHDHPNRDRAVVAMASAVAADIGTFGPERVAALAVSHADCEALADAVRAQVADAGLLSGPGLESPGWTGPRRYHAGDRILLHANLNTADGTRLTNGTVAIVEQVNTAGLAIATADGMRMVMPVEFITGRRPDGRPNLSHAWARTIDGVQGGTFDQVHLLATPALDRYRGYVGQSRSIQPTHTWNTTRAPVGEPGDHGGRVVGPRYTTAERIAGALSRAQPKTFAANDDPYRFEQLVRAAQAQHRAILDAGPTDVSHLLAPAAQTVTARQRHLEAVLSETTHWQNQQDSTGGLRRITRRGRQLHQDAGRRLDSLAGDIDNARDRLRDARNDYDHLSRQQADVDAYQDTNAWRRQRITQLDERLDRNWADAVLSAARDGYPYSYGTSRLRAARRTIIDQIEHLGTQPPPRRGQHDPLHALIELDQAINDAADRSPPRTPRRPARPSWPTLDNLWHHPYRRPTHEPPTPSRGLHL
jgi:hypothetical protein